MYRDPRGGHNKKSFNEDFFKTWTPQMAYILGFIAADGAVIDAKKSSRSCYIKIQINDLDLLQEIRKAMKSNHPITIRPPHFNKFKNGYYLCKESYSLRFGSKVMFQDLINLGMTPRKSLRLKLSKMQSIYLPHFIRGYFDGDGCINVDRNKLQLIFTSGCKSFLDNLSNNLSIALDIKTKNINTQSKAYRLRYKKKESIKILNFMYKNLISSPYLERKYLIAKPYLET